MTYIPIMQAYAVACLIDNISLNVGHFVLSKIKGFKNKSGPMLMFSSLIIKLYKRFEVEEYPGYNYPIYPLNMHGEGASSHTTRERSIWVSRWMTILIIIDHPP